MDLNPEQTSQLEHEAMQPILHRYHQGIEALLLAYMAETGLGLDQIDIKTGGKGGIIRTWIQPKGL